MKVIEHERLRTEPTATPVRAAEYVRMSTDGQQYSIPRQQAAIREYAEQHGMTVVQTYADRGRSGLRLKNRPALIQLLDDVQHGSPDFEIVLVYDVSRWGRFQDTDESAFWEYMCRRAGLRVEYCVEPFVNDGGPLTAILKNIKRVMAAEYSREHSTRVRRSISAAVNRGHFGGGKPNYGLRRILVGPDGKAKGILKRGQYRALHGDHMLLTLGPREEVATVRRIFRLYTKGRLTPPEIARKLNAEVSTNRAGLPWSGKKVYELLRCERYTGTLTYNRTLRLNFNSGPRLRNKPENVIRIPSCFPAIISRNTFDAAQKIIRERGQHHYTDEELLDRLRQLLRQHGRLHVKLIDAAAPPSSFTYANHFGSLSRAYALVGYRHLAWVKDYDRRCRVGEIAEALLLELEDTIRASGATVLRKSAVRDLIINQAVRLTVAPAFYIVTPNKAYRRWRFDFRRDNVPTFTVIARVDEFDERALDFYLMPATHMLRTEWRLGPRLMAKLKTFHCPTMEDLTRRLLAEIHGAGELAPPNN